MSEASEKPFRLLPRVTPANEHFWRGGREGELRFLRCGPCGTFVHPPSPRCPACHCPSYTSPPAISHLGFKLQVTIIAGYKLQATSLGLRVACYKLP